MLIANRAYHIVIAEDDTEISTTISLALEKEGFETTLTSTRAQAMYAIEEQCDLLLLDIVGLKGQGYELLRQIRSDELLLELPVILVTDYEAINFNVLRSIEDLQDIVEKPIRLETLVKRIQASLEIVEQRKELTSTNQLLQDVSENLQQSNLQMIQKNEAIMILKEELEQARIIDPLTGLHNRRYTIEQLGIAISRFNRSGVLSSIILCNIDHLKYVNDQYGTGVGDEVIIKIAQILTSHKRKEDIIARWSGQEFLVLLPDTGLEGAKIFAERARRNVMKQQFESQNQVFQVSMTFGIAVYNQVMPFDMLLRFADDAMLLGKDQGRNRVVLAGDLIVDYDDRM